MRTVIWFIKIVFYLLFAIPDMKRAGRLREAGDTEAFRSLIDWRVKNFSDKMLANAGVTVEVHGKENLTGEPCIFVPNHQGDFDIMVLLSYLDRPYPLVSKDDLAKIPLVRTWMDYLGCIFLDRNNLKQALRAMGDAGRLVEEENSVIIFPEGTRSRGEDVAEFKQGAFKTAFKYKARVVPVSIDGSYRIFEGNKNRIRPGHVILTILPPIETGDLDREAQKELPGKVRQQILEAREKSRAQARG